MKARQKPGVVFQPHVSRRLQRGIHKMVGAVSPTLGPLGGGVAIDHLNNTNPLPEFVDDAGVIARRIIELCDRDEDIGAMLVRSMILRQHMRHGDGTATAAVVFQAVYDAGIRYISAGGNAMRLRHHLERAIPCMIDMLDEMAFQLEGRKALSQMALSLCHDSEMAELLGESLDLLGAYGRLEIREAYGRRLYREYVEGSHFYAGAISNTLLPDTATKLLQLENAALFLSDLSVEEHTTLFPVLRSAFEANVNALVIVVRSLSDKAIGLLATHNRMNKFPVVAVKLPGLNPEDRMAALEDLQRMTGATPFLEVAGPLPDSIAERHFGRMRRFWADPHSFGFVGGKGDPRQLRDHLRKLKKRSQKTLDVDDRKKLHDRIGTLLGGAITLWVGGQSQPEISARKALADRTALALRGAYEEGVLPGGGMAFLQCADRLRQQMRTTHDEEAHAAYRILSEALAAPARTIWQNAGYDPGEVTSQLHHAGKSAVFDAVTGKVVDVREAGILDSASVLKACIRHAVGSAALALTIDSVVHLARPEMAGEPT
jgi:chaperonin GroEL